MHSRADLVDYLCNQQHAARLLGQLAVGNNITGFPWCALSPELREVDRIGVRTVLEELEDLGLLVSSRVPA
jgi:hypothetical protein